MAVVGTGLTVSYNGVCWSRGGNCLTVILMAVVRICINGCIRPDDHII